MRKYLALGGGPASRFNQLQITAKPIRKEKA